MAEQRNLKEEKKDLQDILKLEERLSSIREANVNIGFSAVESLKELYGINSKNTEAERETLKTARAINNVLLDQGKAYSSINALQRDYAKRDNLIRKSQQLQGSIAEGIDKRRLGRINAIVDIQDKIIQSTKDEKDIEESKLGATKEQRAVANSNLLIEREKQKSLSKQFDDRVALLSPMEQELLFSKLGTQELEKSNKLREEALKKVKPASQFLQILGAIPGFSNIAEEAQQDLLDATIQSIEEGGKGLNTLDQVANSLKAGFAAATSPLALALASVTLLVRNFNALSEAQTAFVRQTGQTPTRIGLLNDGLVTSVDLIQTQVALTEQLGVNAAIAFPPETIQAASELTKAIGLSAEASGRFAQFSQITGTNLENSLDALVQSVPKAFSQQKILEETANVSSDIAVSLGNSVNEIGDAVIKANQLGLSLQQVNDIAGSLLDIESSIAAEFEAEVITGKQLNLERARFFALTNDLEGLTEEIGKNQEVINSFANATRIEQEAIAGALGMSREQMADMVLQSDLINNLTDKQRANAKGITLEQLKQLDAQQAFNDTITKLTQALIPGVKLLTDVLNIITKISGFIGAAVVGMTTFKAISASIIAIEKVNLDLKKKQTLQEAAQAAIKSIGNPYALAGGLIAGGLAFAASKKYINQAGDAIIPAGKGPIISTREGGLIQGTANDDVVMAPGIARGGRNAGLSQADIAAIAKAVRDGASQAQINLDGGRVSNRLQPSLAVNTRKYSI